MRIALMLASSFALCAVFSAQARPHYRSLDSSVYDFTAASGEAMGATLTTDGHRCVCAPGWLNNDRVVRAMVVDGPATGAVFALPGAPLIVPGGRVVGGPGGMIAYKTTSPTGQSTIAVVEPIRGPGQAVDVAYLVGLANPVDILDFIFTPGGSLYIAERQDVAGQRRYNLYDCFPTQWSASAFVSTSNVSCETIVCKMGRVELGLRGGGVADDLIVLAGQLSDNPPITQVAALLRSDPSVINVIEIPGRYAGHEISDGETYVALNEYPGTAGGAVVRVFSGRDPSGPEAVAGSSQPVSGLATGKRQHKPMLLCTTAHGLHGSGSTGLALAMFDQTVPLTSMQSGAEFEGRIINSLGWSYSDWVLDHGALRYKFLTIQFADGDSGILEVSEIGTDCLGDGDGSLTVTFADVTAALAGFGNQQDPFPRGPLLGDSNFDGAVNFADITATLANFGDDCR